MVDLKFVLFEEVVLLLMLLFDTKELLITG